MKKLSGSSGSKAFRRRSLHGGSRSSTSRCNMGTSMVYGYPSICRRQQMSALSVSTQSSARMSDCRKPCRLVGGAENHFAALFGCALPAVARDFRNAICGGRAASIFSDRQERFRHWPMLCKRPSSRIGSKAIIVPLSLGLRREETPDGLLSSENLKKQRW